MMQRGMTMIESQEGEKSNLNNDELGINRGVELLLRKRRRKESEPKTFEVKFGKMIALFRREFHFYVEFSFDYKKKFSGERQC